MPISTEVYSALANEARRSELKSKIAELRGGITATSQAVSRLSVLNSDANQQLVTALDELAALETGAGPGITADFGIKSIVTQLLETERAAAKSACIDYIKNNPNCSEEQAAGAWDFAAVDSHVEIVNEVLQPGLAMGRLYRVNLYSQQLIGQPTWEAQRAWILATPKDTIMSS